MKHRKVPLPSAPGSSTVSSTSQSLIGPVAAAGLPKPQSEARKKVQTLKRQRLATQEPVPTIKLGQTDLMVSRLCLGTMTFGLQTDEVVAHALLDKAMAAGINFIDTANVYPLGGDLDSVGRTEEIVGRWLAKTKRRNQTVLATKAVGRTGPKAGDQGSSRTHLLNAVDASLRRLGTDYVDLYQLHYDDPHTPLDETLEALDLIVRSGRARHIGVSNFQAWRLATMLGRCDVLSQARVVTVQPRYSLLFREIERDLLPLARDEGLAVLTYNPLAGGLLTGKYRFRDGPLEGTRFTLGAAGERYQQRYWHEREFITVEALRLAAFAMELVLPTAAIAWVLANPAVTAAIIGASRLEQLDSTLAGVNLQLRAELKARFDELTAQYRQGDAPN